MQHFYSNIEGWFTFNRIYSEVVRSASNGHHFVEVGSWKGASAAFMAVEIINSEKTIKFDCVDTWQGSPENGLKTTEEHEKLYNDFLRNIESVKNIVNPIRKPSLDAASLYPEKSLDFVFIDAAHDYTNVLADLNAWFPKIKSNGVIAGHDYFFPDVKNAVRHFFGSKNLNIQDRSDELSWLVYLK